MDEQQDHLGVNGQTTGEMPVHCRRTAAQPRGLRRVRRSVDASRPRSEELHRRSYLERRRAGNKLRKASTHRGGRRPLERATFLMRRLQGTSNAVSIDAMSVDGMPEGVRLRFLAPGVGRREVLCIIHNDCGGAIVAFGYGRDPAAARLAACRDLQIMRRGRVTLALCRPVV